MLGSLACRYSKIWECAKIDKPDIDGADIPHNPTYELLGFY
jgi:hypothetical protein